MNSAKQHRLNRIFGLDGKALIAALDHGIAGIHPLGNLQDPQTLLPRVVNNGADAVILTPGIAKKYGASLAQAGLVLRIDGGPSALTGNWDEMDLVRSAEDALCIGADAVIMMAITGTAVEAASLQRLGRVAARCDNWGLPLFAEVLPGGFATGQVTEEMAMVSARLAAELGADVIKIAYTGSAASFKTVTEACYQPVVVLGGSRQPADELVRDLSEALSAGAKGAAVGRNIWQSDEPETITAQLCKAIHPDG